MDEAESNDPVALRKAIARLEDQLVRLRAEARDALKAKFEAEEDRDRGTQDRAAALEEERKRRLDEKRRLEGEIRASRATLASAIDACTDLVTNLAGMRVRLAVRMPRQDGETAEDLVRRAAGRILDEGKRLLDSLGVSNAGELIQRARASALAAYKEESDVWSRQSGEMALALRQSQQEVAEMRRELVDPVVAQARATHQLKVSKQEDEKRFQHYERMLGEQEALFREQVEKLQKEAESQSRGAADTLSAMQTQLAHANDLLEQQRLENARLLAELNARSARASDPMEEGEEEQGTASSLARQIKELTREVAENRGRAESAASDLKVATEYRARLEKSLVERQGEADQLRQALVHAQAVVGQQARTQEQVLAESGLRGAAAERAIAESRVAVEALQAELQRSSEARGKLDEELASTRRSRDEAQKRLDEALSKLRMGEEELARARKQSEELRSQLSAQTEQSKAIAAEAGSRLTQEVSKTERVRSQAQDLWKALEGSNAALSETTQKLEERVSEATRARSEAEEQARVAQDRAVVLGSEVSSLRDRVAAQTSVMKELSERLGGMESQVARARALEAMRKELEAKYRSAAETERKNTERVLSAESRAKSEKEAAASALREASAVRGELASSEKRLGKTTEELKRAESALAGATKERQALAEKAAELDASLREALKSKSELVTKSNRLERELGESERKAAKLDWSVEELKKTVTRRQEKIDKERKGCEELERQLGITRSEKLRAQRELERLKGKVDEDVSSATADALTKKDAAERALAAAREGEREARIQLGVAQTDLENVRGDLLAAREKEQAALALLESTRRELADVRQREQSLSAQLEEARKALAAADETRKTAVSLVQAELQRAQDGERAAREELGVALRKTEEESRAALERDTLLRGELERSAASASELQLELQSATAAREEMARRLGAVERDAEEANKELAAASASVSALTEQLREANLSLEASRVVARQQVQEADGARAEVARLATALERSKERGAALSSELKVLRGGVVDGKLALDQSLSRASDAEGLLAEARTQLALARTTETATKQWLQEARAKLETARAEERRTALALEAKERDLVNLRLSSQAALEAVRATATASHDHALALVEGRVALLSERQKELQAQAAERQAALEARTAEMKGALERAERAEGAVADARKGLAAQLVEYKAQCEARVAQAKDGETRALAAARDADERVARIEAEVRAVTDQNRAAVAYLVNRGGDGDGIQAIGSLLARRTQELEDAVRQAEAERAKARQTIEQTNGARSEDAEARRKLEQRLAECEAEIGRLRAKAAAETDHAQAAADPSMDAEEADSDGNSGGPEDVGMDAADSKGDDGDEEKKGLDADDDVAMGTGAGAPSRAWMSMSHLASVLPTVPPYRKGRRPQAPPPAKGKGPSPVRTDLDTFLRNVRLK